MVTEHYDRLEEDRRWMDDYNCVQIIEERDADEKLRPMWKQLMTALERGDELVIAKFSNAIRGSRELASFLEFCRIKVIRIISIHDRIDSYNELFPETKVSDVLEMIGCRFGAADVHIGKCRVTKQIQSAAVTHCRIGSHLGDAGIVMHLQTSHAGIITNHERCERLW